ncbi:MAG: D-alanyl-D-alanine carboxypeptidase/D-alanyl-D-alanine-endopeptidase, partial [Rhodothermales bacterium]
LQLEIDRLIDADAFSHAFWGVHAVDMETGRTIYSRNASKNFVPASNVKLYTTAAALDQLGPFFRYETSLYVDGPVENGILRGNLIVRGAADPTFGGHYHAQSGTWDRNIDGLSPFRGWADSLRAAGIRYVDGDIVGDDDVIDDEPLGASWSWDDETYYYSAQIGGLSFHDNVIHLHVEGTDPGGPAAVRWEPFNTSYVDVVNRSLTVDQEQTVEEGYRRVRGTNTIDVTSRVPVGGEDVEEITVENPTRYFVHVLRESLMRSGIAVAGKPIDVDDISIKPDYEGAHLRRIAVHRSPLLPDVAALVNKASQNLYADNLIKTLAAHVPHDDDDLAPGSSERGIDIAMKTFVRAGIDTSRIRLVDGSGLSRLNLIAPNMTTSLLEYMWRHDDRLIREAFYASLPLAAETGTLRYRLADGPAAGRMRGKSGSLSGVSTLSGYVESAGGRTIAFSIACNHFTSPASRVRAAQDAIVHALARYQP